MAKPQQIRKKKVSAYSKMGTRRCDSSPPASPRPTLVSDPKAPTTGRKRKQRTLRPYQQATEDASIEHRDNQSKSSSSSSNSYRIWDRAERSYWDSLSTLRLTSDCLREFNRQNALMKTSVSKTIPAVEHPERYGSIYHFARHGGPDLSDIRNHRKPEGILSRPTLWSSRKASKSKPDRKSPVDEEEESGGSSAYDSNYEHHLTQNHVFRCKYHGKRPANHQEWVEAIKQPRASLSSLRMSDEYEALSRAADDARNDKGQLMIQVLPKLMGEKNSYRSGKRVKFDNLEPLTQRILDARPDYYEGHHAGLENRLLREKLRTIIFPSIRKDTPFLPNFFVQINDDGGSFAVAESQARHVGALAARGMHRLQCLGRTEAYDSNAYTISAIYYAQILNLYTHHLTQPEGPGSPPPTHMIALKSVPLFDSPESLYEGLTAIRNASEKANEYREQFIESANLRLESDTPQDQGLGWSWTHSPLLPLVFNSNSFPREPPLNVAATHIQSSLTGASDLVGPKSSNTPIEEFVALPLEAKQGILRSNAVHNINNSFTTNTTCLNVCNSR